MRRFVTVAMGFALVGMFGVAEAQSDGAAPTVAALMAEMLQRGASGHSPTLDEVQAVEGLPGVTDPKVAKQAAPLLVKALADPDSAMRKYALAMLVGMQTLPDAAGVEGGSSPVSDGSGTPAATAPPKGQAAVVSANGPSAYKTEVAKALAPAIPGIASRLTDDDPDNRLLAATVMGGFAPDPPATVYASLLAYLKRDDAVGAVGLAVVSDLLQFGAVSDETAAAIGRYLRRSDQTIDARSNLVEAIASKPNQSKAVNKALLSYLDSDDASLRARTILSLPQLDLATDVFADTKARVADIAAGGQDSLQVVNAAKAVTGCWTTVKMTAGCPVY